MLTSYKTSQYNVNIKMCSCRQSSTYSLPAQQLERENRDLLRTQDLSSRAVLALTPCTIPSKASSIKCISIEHFTVQNSVIKVCCSRCQSMTHLSFLFRSRPAMSLRPHDVMHSYSLMAPVGWHRQRKVGWPEGHCLCLHRCNLFLMLQPARSVRPEQLIC